MLMRSKNKNKYKFTLPKDSSAPADTECPLPLVTPSTRRRPVTDPSHTAWERSGRLWATGRARPGRRWSSRRLEPSCLQAPHVRLEGDDLVRWPSLEAEVTAFKRRWPSALQAHRARVDEQTTAAAPSPEIRATISIRKRDNVEYKNTKGKRVKLKKNRKNSFF